MTDKEKMQKLFDAALRDPRQPDQIKPTPAYYTPAGPAASFQPQPAAAPFQPQAAQFQPQASQFQPQAAQFQPQMAAVPFQAAVPAAYPVGVQPGAGYPQPSAYPQPQAYQAVPSQMPAAAPAAFMDPAAGFTAPAAPQDLVVPMPNAGLDAATSAELAALLDEQHRRKVRRRRRDSLITVVLLFGLTGGGYGWFVQDPQRVQAFHDAIKDIRSAGDVAGLVAKYKKALEKVKVRSEQIDSATASMGIDPTKDDGKDPYFEEEMKGMMGGEGKTTGERNRLLKEKFGSAEKTGKIGVPSPASAASIPSQPQH